MVIMSPDKLVSSDGAASDYFGFSVSISGNYAIVGACCNDDNGTDSGSAYIYEFVDGVWTQQRKLTASDGTGWENFGFSVSISGNYAIVGARNGDNNGSNSGSVYIYELGTWTEQKLTASDGASGDEFGYSVSIDGNYAIVGARYDDDYGTDSGSVYVYELGHVDGAKAHCFRRSRRRSVWLFGVGRRQLRHRGGMLRR